MIKKQTDIRIRSCVLHVDTDPKAHPLLLLVDFSIKIHDLSDLKEMYAIIVLEDERKLDRIQWSDDGQLLAVSTPQGALHVYLAQLPMLASVSQTRIAHLTSLLEVTVEDGVAGVSTS